MKRRPCDGRRPSLPALVVVAGLTVPFGGDVRGWTLQVREHVAADAARLLPTSLQRQLYRHWHPLRQGIWQAPCEGEACAAEPRLAAAVDRAVAGLDSRHGFGSVVGDFGHAAEAVLRLSHPFGVATEHPTERAAFDLFVGARIDRLRVVFEGLDDDGPVERRVERFARRCRDRATGLEDDILREFGHAPGPAHFERYDDRSTLFATASLAYSNAVNCTARLWLHIWERAHGDMTGRFDERLATGPREVDEDGASGTSRSGQRVRQDGDR